MMTFKSKYFYGNEVSQYGQENKRVDYYTFSKAFHHVINNDIMQQTEAAGLGYWEQESGYIDNSDEIEELQDQIDDLELEITEETQEEEDRKIWEKIEELQDKITELEEEQDSQPEVFQWYIIDDGGAEICKEFNEIVYYNSELDMYLWGVTHYGTSWDYVLTDIEIEEEPEELTTYAQEHREEAREAAHTETKTA